MKMTEHDEAVYRIIGEDSKVLDGLKVAESSGSCDLPPEKENVPPNATKSSQLCSKQRAQKKTKARFEKRLVGFTVRNFAQRLDVERQGAEIKGQRTAIARFADHETATRTEREHRRID